MRKSGFAAKTRFNLCKRLETDWKRWDVPAPSLIIKYRETAELCFQNEVLKTQQYTLYFTCFCHSSESQNQGGGRGSPE